MPIASLQKVSSNIGIITTTSRIEFPICIMSNAALALGMKRAVYGLFQVITPSVVHFFWIGLEFVTLPRDHPLGLEIPVFPIPFCPKTSTDPWALEFL